MKILCVSDHRDSIVYSSYVKTRFSDVDLILGAGDLELEYYGFIVSSLNKPLLFVFGNHNLSRLPNYRKKLGEPFSVPGEISYLAPSFGSTHIGGRVRRIKGVIFAGFGGTRNYNNGLNQFSERAMFMRIAKIIPKLLWNRIAHGRYLDILLTHTPPFDVGDLSDVCHRGFKVFRWFNQVFQPKYHIHGHIHLYDLNAKREITFQQTRVVNAYNHVVIEIDTDND